MPSTSRTFTHFDLLHGITNSQYHDLPEPDKAAFNLALTALWERNSARADAHYLAGDYDRLGSNRRFELGE